ncbi:MAG: hypothetical protein LBK60_01920 [Verrucomicrobiales bacterium]|nr:hypothetical protein [Verrucomicrobiales bacterium]
MKNNGSSHEGTRTRRKNYLIGKIPVPSWLRVSLLLLGFTVSGRSAELPRVAVSVSGSDGERWQSVLTVELSKSSELQIVERQEAERVWRERGQLAWQRVATGDAPPPSLLGINRYLHFREIASGKWLVENIDGASGRLLGSAVADGGGFDAAPVLAAAGRRLLDNAPVSTDADRRPTIAVIEIPREEAFIFAARLREALTVSGCAVLDRALTQDLAITINESERGMRDVVPNQKFLGVTHTLIVDMLNSGNALLTLINNDDGKLADSKTFTISNDASIDHIQQWLLPLLGKSIKELPPYTPSVEIEALQPFYRGMKLWHERKHAEATSEFTRAYLINRQFREAYGWESSCYELLGFPQLRDAVRRYEKIMLDYAASTNAIASPGVNAIAFLGIGGEPRELAIRLSAIFASALAAQERDIILPDSLAQVAREYDWQAGLNDTNNRHWNQTRGFLCHKIANGTLTIKDNQPVIR